MRLTHSLIAILLATCLPQIADAGATEPFGWMPTSALPQSMYQLDPVEHNGWIYVIGGYTGGANGTPVSTVYAAQIQANGTLSAWVELASLPEVDQGPGVAIFNKTIYVSCMDSGNLYRAVIQPDGTLGTWIQEVKAPAAQVGRLNLRAYNGTLYLVGAWAGGSADVHVAAIHSDGSLGSWSTTTPMPEGRQHQSLQFFNDRVYIAGGFPVTASVISAPVNQDGTIGEWRTTETNLPTTLWYHSGAMVNGEIYIFAGRTSYTTGVTSSILKATIDPTDGSIDGWTIVGQVPDVETQALGVVFSPVHGGMIFLIGGGAPTDGTATTTNKVWVNRRTCTSDVTGDNTVGVPDLLKIINAWGPCP